MNRQDWNLLILSAASGASLSPVQYQKCLFLLGKAFPYETGVNFYHFRNYNYGAFDEAVYEDAEDMQIAGLVNIGSASGKWKQYSATPEGLRAANEMQGSIPPQVCKYIKDLVGWARSLSFPDLVRAVYEAYPDTRENSIFKD